MPRYALAVLAAVLMCSGLAFAESRISVPTDPRATYSMLSNTKLPNGNRQAVTRRMGPSGQSFSRREINCGRMTFRYTGDGDTLAELNRPYDKGSMGPLTEGSISTYVALAACRR